MTITERELEIKAQGIITGADLQKFTENPRLYCWIRYSIFDEKTILRIRTLVENMV